MAYTFVTAPTANFKFTKEGSTDTISLNGINPTLSDANIIAEGVSSLIAISGIEGVYHGAVRTVKQNVNDNE